MRCKSARPRALYRRLQPPACSKSAPSRAAAASRSRSSGSFTRCSFSCPTPTPILTPRGFAARGRDTPSRERLDRLTAPDAIITPAIQTFRPVRPAGLLFPVSIAAPQPAPEPPALLTVPRHQIQRLGIRSLGAGQLRAATVRADRRPQLCRRDKEQLGIRRCLGRALCREQSGLGRGRGGLDEQRLDAQRERSRPAVVLQP